MFCQSCGNEQSANVNFCKKCGNRIIQLQNENQSDQIHYHIDLARPFRWLALLGIGGLTILTILFFNLFERGARDEVLFLPFIFGCGLIGIISLVMGFLFKRVIGKQIIEQKIPLQKSRTQNVVRSTGQIALPEHEDTYSPGSSVVDEATRKFQQ